MARLPRGIHTIVYALFDATGALDRQAMREEIEICLGHGAAGLATLGLASEVRYFTTAQRRQMVEWNASDIAGRVPLGVTIFGDTPEAEIELIRHAEEAGADWIILQPPACARDEASLVEAFSRVLESTSAPIALQNMPQFLGVGLSVEAIAALARRYGHIVGVKQEVAAIETAELVAQVRPGGVQVFSGRGGIELVDCMLAGVEGHIPAPEFADSLVRLWALMDAGREAEARDIYARILPLATFILQSLETLTTYGKLLFCLRYGLPFHQRAGALAPTAFGVRALAAHARRVGIDTADWSARLPAPLAAGLESHGGSSPGGGA